MKTAQENSVVPSVALVHEACSGGMFGRHVQEACSGGMFTRHVQEACSGGMFTRHVRWHDVGSIPGSGNGGSVIMTWGVLNASFYLIIKLELYHINIYR